jgi:hypothetical protein
MKTNRKGSYCVLPECPLVYSPRPGEREQYYLIRGEEKRNGSANETETA